jgi:hypothetical protein
VKIIPQNATAKDPAWEPHLLWVAHGLILAGAKVKLVVKLTGISHRHAKSTYRGLLGVPPPAGPIARGNARFFALPNAQASAGWNVQCAIFLGCFERIATITETTPHRGWHLLAAFRSYISLTEPLWKATAVTRLDINQAWGLLTHCGFLENPKAEIQRRLCPNCLVNYLVIAGMSLRHQPCPICSIDSNRTGLNGRGSLRRRQKVATSK